VAILRTGSKIPHDDANQGNVAAISGPSQLLWCGNSCAPVLPPVVTACAPVFSPLVAAYAPLVTPLHPDRLGFSI